MYSQNIFKDKVAVITGASRGIGRSVAFLLSKLGATVAINYKQDKKSADEFVQEVEMTGGKIKAFCCDVSQVEAIEEMMENIYQEFGKIDFLVSNAGIEYFGSIENTQLSDFNKVFSVNVAGQLFSTKAALKYMQEGGSIVLTSSVSARVSVYHHALYAASKAAVSALVANLAPELGEKGIRINAIAPGGTKTDMAKDVADLYIHPELRAFDKAKLTKSKTALRRFALPDEIAKTTLFLLSDNASYITGATIPIDGGYR